MSFREYLEESKKYEKQHEEYIKLYKKKGTNLKDLFNKYKKKGLMTKSVTYDEWVQYMEDEIKARKG